VFEEIKPLRQERQSRPSLLRFISRC